MVQNFSKSSSNASLKKAPRPPFPFAHHVIDPAKGDQDIQEALKTLAEYKKKQERIERELDSFYQNLGMTSREIQAYLENSNNFSREEWEHMQRERQSLLSSLIAERELGKIGEEFKEALLSPQATETKKRKKVQKTRRNWIPLR